MIYKDFRSKVSYLCVEGVLNCIRANTTTGNNYPFTEICNSINMEVLRYYWALTNDIEELAKIVSNSPRRLTTSLTYEEVERRGEITGSINAAATFLAQARTLDPTIFIVNEPNMTYQSESNFLVAWVLKEALDILMSAKRLYKKLNKLDWYNSKISLLEQALRNEILKELLLSPLGNKRPSNSAVRSASKSRVPVYQLAVRLYNLLEQIESGDEGAITSCLEQTLVADLDYWQRLELGVALKATTALSSVTNQPILLRFPFISGKAISEVGQFSVYWQYTIPQRPLNKLDTSEKWTREVAASIGVNISDSRADVAITFENKVVSLFECKYFESESAVAQAVLDASSQLVRYSRDLHPSNISFAETLLTHCSIILATRNKYQSIITNNNSLSNGERKVYFLDIDDLLNNSLGTWAKELVSICSSH
jgi:hypothetical protein